MRFSKATFTHPLSVPFLEDPAAEHPRPHSAFAHVVGSVSTIENQSSPAVDSIEADGHWVVIRWNGQTKCVPAAKIESADLLEEPRDPARRGPGRPSKAEIAELAAKNAAAEA